MKIKYLYLILLIIVSCSDDDSTSEPILTKERVVGTWKLISKNRLNSSENIATTCDLEKAKMWFNESNQNTRTTGNFNSDTSNCTSLTFNSNFYILPNAIRLESGNNKRVYSSKVVSDKLYMTLTSTSTSSGSTPVPVEDQLTEVYIRQ